MSRTTCASFLCVSLETVRGWELGRCRANWAAVRLLKLYRLGDLGALQPQWAGWTLSADALVSPDGRCYRQRLMRQWWTTIEQARFWRQRYDQRTPHQLPLF